MKTKDLRNTIIAVFATTLILLSFSSCEEQAGLDNIDASVLAAGSDSPGTESLTNDSLSNDCLSSLAYMREEEQLAHDVYVKMFDLWDAKVFENIAKSETKHTDAVKGLLEFFDIDDPVLPGEGEFANEKLQELYDNLVESGSASLIEALKVGATIEEVDIIDLDKAMENCDVDTVITVYSRLRRGSTHHLRAFVANISKQGVKYEPQFLTREEYDKIINDTDSVNGGKGNGECKDTINVGTITDTEAAGLRFMREEEKLAHDVYVNLYAMWGIRTFDNISKSETQHSEKVLSLLDLYGIEDPALPNIGEFSDEDLQSLYDKLMEQGKDSEIAALIVGATIEEVDILDLDERMEQTDNSNILKVYSSLEKGSEAHLRAFVAQLKLRGYYYEPQFLSQEEFDDIINKE